MNETSSHWKQPRRRLPVTGNCARILPGLLATTLALAAAVPVATAQQNAPHIGYIYPAGGQHGSTFEVVIGGQFLNGVTNALVSDGGVKVTVTKHLKLLTSQQLNGLRNSIERLMALDDVVKTNAARKGEAEALRVRLTTQLHEAGIEEVSLRALRDYQRKNDISKKSSNQVNPAISETVDLRVTVAPDAEPGDRELRLEVLNGLSNPMVFRVGGLPEFTEKEATANTAEVGAPVTLPVVVNGQILPGDIDRYRFQAKKGARLVIAASARELIPYLADAVPGWFQATIKLSDSAGKEVAYDDDFRFSPDPVLFYEIPADGEYTVEIQDSIFRGREDFVYRITIGEVPFINSIFPLGGPAGEETKVELKGWNLPSGKVTMDNRKKEPGVYTVSTRKGDWISNLMPFSVDTLPEIVEKDSHDERGDAQTIKLPVIVNGRISQPGKPDFYKFEGKAGAEIVAEINAHRLNSPMDSEIKLTDSDGKVIACNDDCDDRGSGLETHHADSYLCAKLPADGTYFLEVTDTQRQAGPEYAYRLRVSPPMPDFALRVVPASVNARPGGTASLTVYALRRDGLTNAISLALKDPPAGFKLQSAGTISGTQEFAKLTFAVPFNQSPSQPVKLNVEGRATVAGKDIVHTAVPAEDMMQAFFYRHLVASDELYLGIGGRAFGSGKFGDKLADIQKKAAFVKIISPTPVKIPAGGTAVLKLNIPAYELAEKAELKVKDAPGIYVKSVKAAAAGGEITLACDASKCKPGSKGSLIISAYSRKSANPDKSKGGFQFMTLPALPYEIVAK